MILLWLFTLFLYSNTALRQPICPVCYDEPCYGTDKFRLFCSLAQSTQCGQCNSSCTQCNSTDSIYVCTCPAPYPTRSPTPPTKSPTSAPTYSPTRAPTNAPTPAPTYAPTPPVPPVVLIFMPTRAPIESTNEPTTAPTGAPTKSPTRSPTPAPTYPPPQFNTCQYCQNANPPLTVPCNDDQHKLRILCKASDNTCTICPPYCSFCFGALRPSPAHVCACPATPVPTLSPTKAPTYAPTYAPTGAPTTHLPDLVSKDTMNDIVTITIHTVIIAFACVVAVITVIFCCVVRDSLLFKQTPDHEL